MRLEYHLPEDGGIKISCTGKFRVQRDWMTFKDYFCSTLEEHPECKQITISFEQPKINLSVLGLLLKYINVDGYEIQLLVLHYSCFRMLEDMLLLEKFNVKYQKV
ncbi:MAG TPA: hypothetical protein IAA23_02055 [Candidatus Helicobacter avistercoris]|nr:hypothetical protein [Candidatus Helicobacter avistercoris]